MSGHVPMYVVYLICADLRDSKPVHYVGITTQRNFGRRIQDHLSGNGTTTTAELYEQGFVLSLVGIHLTDDHHDERRLQQLVKQPNYKCAICSEPDYQSPYQNSAEQRARAERAHLLQRSNFDKEKGHALK